MKKEEKKSRQISISHELYQEILSNVVELFQQQKQIENKSQEESKPSIIQLPSLMTN